MPTGYTSCIEDGVTFDQFVMGCARAFGACVTMRDDSHDTPIPKEFKPSTYHKEEIEKHKKEIERVKALPIQECMEAALKDYKSQIASCKRYMKSKAQLQEKYNKMLDQVRAWECPASHVEFKSFMIKQIEESIDFDCNVKYTQDELDELLKDGPMTGVEWKAAKLHELMNDLQYDIKEDKEEVDRVAGRNKWIKDLRESLAKVGAK